MADGSTSILLRQRLHGISIAGVKTFERSSSSGAGGCGALFLQAASKHIESNSSYFLSKKLAIFYQISCSLEMIRQSREYIFDHFFTLLISKHTLRCD